MYINIVYSSTASRRGHDERDRRRSAAIPPIMNSRGKT